MGKGKLGKFEEMKSFPNVIQPLFEEVYGKDFHMKGKWASEYFRNNNPLILELGCGKGEYSVGLAELFPGSNFIGVDIKGARIWTGAREALGKGLQNVAFIRTRIEFINSFFDHGEVDELWLTFPDPQLKKRRNKKRLTSSRFLNSYRGFLRNGGLIHLKTDSPDLYSYTCELVKENGLTLEVTTDDLYGSSQTALVHGIQTFYEKQFVEEGLKIHYLRFKLPDDQIIREPESVEE